MINNKTICLCLIVKNEAKVIHRLIRSCKHFIDYYVICDTGSSDNTIEVIKKEMGDIKGEIYERKWIGFDVNRTELMGFSYKKSDYLLIADADEEFIITDDFYNENFTYDWYHFRYVGDLDYTRIHLVNANIKWRYLGKLHEYIDYVDNSQSSQTLELNTIKVLHHDDGSSMLRTDKILRDIKILKQAIKDEPNNERNYFYMAQTYNDNKEYEKAIIYYEERIKRGGWEEEVYYSMLQIGISYYYLKKIDKAIIKFIDTYSFRPTRFESLYMLGVIYREQNKFHFARLVYEEVLNMPYPKDILFIDKTCREYLADYELAICYYWMEDYEKAKFHALLVDNKNNIPEEIYEQNKKNLKFILDKINTI
jgi:tetratricopeptide (TPR) repeat protein